MEKPCECGCGQPAPVAPRTRRTVGWIKGEPIRFIHNHHPGGEHHPQWKGDATGYSGLHRWLRRNFPKQGVCEQCGERKRTEYANLSGEYRRSRDDYRELCTPCHRKLDAAGLARGECHGKAKLKADQVGAIRTAQGTQREIAEQYGISMQYVSKLRAGIRWKHLAAGPS